MSKFYFHGDVVLKQIESIPKKAKIKKTNLLKEGEMTGHAHTIEESLINNGQAKIYEDELGHLFLENKIPIEIKHQQHKGTFTNLLEGLEEKLPAGKWIIDFPNEYDHFLEESRKVID